MACYRPAVGGTSGRHSSLEPDKKPFNLNLTPAVLGDGIPYVPLSADKKTLIEGILGLRCGGMSVIRVVPDDRLSLSRRSFAQGFPAD